MAKCPKCSSRKGQRRCRATGSEVCTPCCGEIRKPATCQGCPYFKEDTPKRNYKNIPSYSTQEMEDDLDLQSISNVIEGALCTWDYVSNDTLRDELALRVLELLMDRYYFDDESVTVSNEAVRKGFDYASRAIDETLDDVSKDVLCRILSVIYFVARRRTRGGREYFTVIRQYVGITITPGMRDLPDFLAGV